MRARRAADVEDLVSRLVDRLTPALTAAVLAVLLAPLNTCRAVVQIVRDADHPLYPPTTSRPARFGAIADARARRNALRLGAPTPC